MSEESIGLFKKALCIICPHLTVWSAGSRWFHRSRFQFI